MQEREAAFRPPTSADAVPLGDHTMVTAYETVPYTRQRTNVRQGLVSILSLIGCVTPGNFSGLSVSYLPRNCSEGPMRVGAWCKNNL